MKSVPLACLLSILLGLVLVFASSNALADAAAQARHHDEEARLHFSRGDFDSALREFFVVQRIAPTTTTLYNIALCFRRLGRADDEFNYLQEYLAGQDADPERHHFALERTRQLAEIVAQVQVSSQPPGARIFIDREDLGAFGATPMVVAVPDGSHKVIVRKPGYAPVETEVTLKTGELKMLELQLELIVGKASFAVPPGSSVVIQDTKAAVVATATAPATIEVPPGSYTARIEAAGFQSHRGLLEVRAGELTEYSPRLVPLPAPSGEITFTSNVPGALIELDGKLVGFAPLVLPEVLVGKHQVSVTKPGLLPYRGIVEVTENEPAWLTTTLEKRVSQPIPAPVLWSTVGLAAGCLATAGVFGILTATKHTELEKHPGDEEIIRDGKQYAAISDGFLIAGTILAVASVVFLALNPGKQRPSKATLARSQK